MTLREDPDPDFDELASQIGTLCVAHPPLVVEWWKGSALYAKLGDMIEASLGVSDDPIHPQSLRAMALSAVGCGILEAALDRLADGLKWDEETRDEAWRLLSIRRRWRNCSCGERIAVTEFFCKTCEQKLIKENT